MTSTQVQSTLPMSLPVPLSMVHEVARDYMMDRDWLKAAEVLLSANLPVPAGIWKAVRSFIEEPARAKDMSIKAGKMFSKKCTIVHKALCSKDKTIRATEVREVLTHLLATRQERAKMTAINHDGSWLLSQEVDVTKTSNYNGLEVERTEKYVKPERRWNFSYGINKAVGEVLQLGGLRQIDDFLTTALVQIYDKRFAFEELELRDSGTDNAVDSAQIAEAFSCVGMGSYTQYVCQDPYDRI